jgi:hypothetical protein
MKTQFLSREEREIGRKNFFTYTLFNGFGFGFLADTTIYLLAIHFGASNIQLGYISSMIYLSGVLLIFTPKLVTGKNLINVYFWAWLLRGLVCLLNAAVLFVTDQIAVAVILVSYTLFCAFRIVGASLGNPVLQSISTASSLGNVLTHNTAYFNFGSIMGKVISFIIVSITIFKGFLGLMVLQAAGVIFNSISSLFIKKIPCREKIEIPPGQNIFVIFFKNIKDKKKIMPLLFYWNFLTIAVFAGFSIPLLKKIVGIEDNIIFLYTILITIATTLGMYMIRPFIDKISVKPFIMLATFSDFIFFIIWAFIKQTTPVYFIFIIGFVSMYLKGINQSMTNRYLISYMPQKENVTYNSMANFFAGIFSLLFGLVAGIAGDIGEKIHPGFFNQYYIIFLIASFLSFVSFILTFLIVDKDVKYNFKIPENIISSFQNLKSLIDVYYLDTAKDPEKRQNILISLKYKSAPFALNEIRKILKNPLSSETEEVLKSLFAKPRMKLLPDILDIACDKGFYHRASAIFALGAYPYPEVEKVLIDSLDDDNPRIKSNAAKSLARIGNKDYLEKIIALSEDKDNTTWDLMNYIIAILTIDKNNSYINRMFEIAQLNPEKSYKQSIFSLFSRVLEFNPELNSIYEKENYEKHLGLKLLLDEGRQFEDFYKNINIIRECYINLNYNKIWELIKNNLTRTCHEDLYCHINESIQNFDMTKADETNTLALLYFYFFILLGESGE